MGYLERRTWILYLIIIVFSSLVIIQVFSADKKLRVIKNGAAIYLNPDEKSPLLENVPQGTIVSLLSPGKFKVNWYYVSYQSSSGAVKSGYIHESSVEPLFQAQKIITIKGEEASYFSVFDFCHLEPSFWGAPIEKIISLEGEPDQRKKLDNLEVLYYQRDLMDYMAYLQFIFNDNSLIQIHIELWQIAGSKNKPLRDYEQIKTCLSTNFGSPFEDIVHWQNPTFRYDELSWGYAVSLGHLIYQTRWINQGVELGLRLRGENKKNWLEVEGTQINYQEIAKKVSRDDFFRFQKRSLRE